MPDSTYDNGAQTYATVGGGHVTNGVQDVANNTPGASSATPVATQEYSSPIGPSLPVTGLSTDAGKTLVQSGLNKLNQYSPTTAPGYVPPPPAKDTATKDTATPPPKAYFTNTNGQEAEYTQEQLNDPATQKFISEGGYAMTKTEGPSYDSSSAAKGELAETDAQIKSLVSNIQNYNVDNDPGFSPLVSNIRGQYGQLISAMQEQNKSRMAALSTLGIRTGSTQYAGAVQSGIEGAELKAADQRILDIVTRENSAISSARTAYQSNKFSEFNNQLNALEKLRGDKQKALDNYSKVITKTLANVQKATAQTTKDVAVADVLKTGVTDPAEIFRKLQEGGNTTVTTKDVAAALKNLSVSTGGDPTKLTGAIGEYFKLKDDGIALPEKIASLPEDEQPFAYAKYKAELTRKPVTPKVPKAVTPKTYTISNTNRGKLVEAGLKDADVTALQGDISTHGLDAVLSNPDSGLSEHQKTLLRAEYAGTKTKASTTDEALSF